MDINKMKYTRQLDDKRRDLESELLAVEEKIMENQSECKQHISLIMRTNDRFPHYGYQFRCLLCGQYMSRASKLSIDARYYLNDAYDERIDSQKEEKFDILQTMALEIATPNMSSEEFINQFNALIQNNITLKTSQSIQENIGESNKQLVRKENKKTK